MGEVLRFKNTEPNVAEMLQRVYEEYPDATEGVIILFTPDGGMHTRTRSCNKNLAWAAADLLSMAVEKD